MINHSSFILSVYTSRCDGHCSAQENTVVVISGVPVESVAIGTAH